MMGRGDKMKKAKILIVEDEKIVAKDIQYSLENLGYTIPAIVSSGEAAIEKMSKTCPDLVLMDIKLKGDMDGVEASEQIQVRFDIPIVYLTAYSDEKLLKRARITEPFGYVIKPFKERELLSMIEMALYKHRMERELKKSRARYKTIVEDQSELIFRFKKDRTITFVNEAFCLYFDKRSEELLGQSYLPFIHEEDREENKRHIDSLNLENPLGMIEQQVVTPCGEIRWQQFTNWALFDDKDRLIEFQSVGRDITELKRAEKELQESEERFRNLFENVENGEILHINEIGAKQLEYNVAELEGQNIDKIQPKDQPDIDYLKGTFAYGARHFKTSFLTHKGRCIYAGVWQSKIVYGGKEAILSVVGDITKLQVIGRRKKQSLQT